MFRNKYAASERLGRIAPYDGDAHLSYCRPGIKLRYHEVHRRAAHRIPGFKGALVRVQPRIFRQERRVDVQ